MKLFCRQAWGGASKLLHHSGRKAKIASLNGPSEYREKNTVLMADSDSVCIKPLLAAWAESFIFAGSSALLLLVANLFPQYWYFSFFALIPFLYKIIKASPSESLRLGLLFGFSFFSATLTDSFVISPLPSVLKLISGTALFTLFGWTVGWARQKWGFNPSIVALLWMGLEIGLIKFGFVGGLFGEAEFSHPFLHGMVGLLGFLVVSALIVLLNSLLVLAIVETIELTRPKRTTVQEEEKKWDFFFTRNLFTEKVYVVPEGRAPPLSIL